MCRSAVLNAYVPRLQVAGQIVRFLRGHLWASDPVAGAAGASVIDSGPR